MVVFNKNKGMDARKRRVVVSQTFDLGSILYAAYILCVVILTYIYMYTRRRCTPDMHTVYTSNTDIYIFAIDTLYMRRKYAVYAP